MINFALNLEAYWIASFEGFTISSILFTLLETNLTQSNVFYNHNRISGFLLILLLLSRFIFECTYFVYATRYCKVTNNLRTLFIINKVTKKRVLYCMAFLNITPTLHQ
jgi:hypothetical protein